LRVGLGQGGEIVADPSEILLGQSDLGKPVSHSASLVRSASEAAAVRASWYLVDMSASWSVRRATCWALGKLVTEKPVDFVGFDNVVEFNKNRQNDDNVVKAYKS